MGIVSKTVPYQDDWGSAHKARIPSDDPDSMDEWGDEGNVRVSTDSPAISFAILADDLPFYAEVIRKLSPKEWGVFFLFYVRKLGSRAQVAKALDVRTGDVWNYLKRIDSKLGRLQRKLNLFQVRFLDSANEDDSEIPVVLSVSQPSPPVIDTNGKRPVCRESAPG